MHSHLLCALLKQGMRGEGWILTRTITYYPAGGAMRINNTLYYILKDHLGSASAVTDASGNLIGEQRFYPFGQTRLTLGSLYTDRLYTGQREITGLGIYHYQARFYSPYLNHFIQGDTIVPGFTNPQNLNRYSYVGNSPINYTDPTGHMRVEELGGKRGCSDPKYCQNGKPKPLPKKVKENISDRSTGSGGISKNQAPTSLISPPDAGFISFSYTSGSLAWYRTWSIDIVITEDEIGIFHTQGVGPGLGSSEIPWSIDQRKMDKSLTSPIVGGTVYGGVIWGDSLRESVQNYQGPSRGTGATVVNISGEYFESVNRETGVPDGNLKGIAIGFGQSSPNSFIGEMHNLYVDSDYLYGHSLLP